MNMKFTEDQIKHIEEICDERIALKLPDLSKLAQPS